MDLVHDLLTAAADDLGWQVDLDQLPVTCAQVPNLVLTLIEASAAHLAALAGARILDDAAASIHDLMAAGQPTGDWEAELLTDIGGLTDTRQPSNDRARRRLIAALRALQSEGATWPPQPGAPGHADTADRSDLAGALAGLGLHPATTTDAPRTDRAQTTYRVARGEHRLTVTVHPDDGDTTEVHVFDRHVLAWSATFHPGTPQSVIVAAVRRALGTATDALPAADPS